ncbi:MAG: pyruvate dehydrogenase (acetyl-transferring) E1 component subunit alpha [Desulfobacterales bacterium]|nr:pyruvate dehydrogenase (acetyl-transferring) E1 component subunit alpha [Desulfobacterales bacterium]
MPKTRIPLPDGIDHLAILDETGTLDAALEPKIAPEVLLRLHHVMLLARRFDERLLSLQRQGRIGTFPPIAGQEAAHLGAAAVLRPDDWMVPAFREMAADIWRGRPLDSIIVYNNGFGEGGRIPAERNDMPISIPVGSQILHAVGIAWGMKYRAAGQVAMAFFGDGATSQGDFHEGLNYAGVFELPAVFVCQNNQWAISIPRTRQTRSRTLAQKAHAYGIAGVQVDGNDLLAVYAAAEEAAQRARSGGGPTLIECVTYRMAVHTTADDPKRYRSDAEVESWRRKDPLTRFQVYLKAKGLLSDADVTAEEERVAAEIQAAVDRAEEQMTQLGDPLHMFEHAYAEMPPYLKEQRDEVARHLAGAKEAADA